MTEFIEKHPRLSIILAALLIVSLTFCGGYVAGMHRTPTTIEKEVVKTQVQEHVVYKDRVVTQKVYVQVEKKHVHTETTTTKNTDGTVVTKVTKDENTDQNTKVDATKTDDKNKTDDKVTVQTIEKIKIVEQKLTWRLGAGAGYSLPHALGQGDIGIPGMNGIVVQAHGDRRIAGPVWLGVFGNTQGTLGLDLSVEW